MLRRWLPLVLLVFSACGGSGARATGESCATAEECEGGTCYGSTCSSVCAGDSDCPAGFTCGTGQDGERLCLSACGDGAFLGYQEVCVNGARVACAYAGASARCDACGCPSGDFCGEDGVTCKPLAAVGQACTTHAECASGNCGFTETSPTGHCLAARGEACTAANCLSCDPTTDGDVCAQNCASQSDCGDGYTCVGNQGDGFYSCRQNCDTMSCPAFWDCRPTGGVPYCEPARRCDPADNLSCGAVHMCDPQYHLCSLFP